MARRRSSLMLTPAVAVAACSLLVAGCGGGGSSGVASIASSSTGATTAAASTTQKTGTLASAFAFARCMRSHGIPGWPDPESNGFFDKSKLRQLGLGTSRVRALEEGPCNIPLPSGGQGQTITLADRTDYLRGAACMRTHGFPDFPDPTFPNNGVHFDFPASMDTSSSRFKAAATICTKLIPPGLPYTRPSGS